MYHDLHLSQKPTAKCTAQVQEIGGSFETYQCSGFVKFMVKSCKSIVPAIILPDVVISQSPITALIYDAVVAKNFFEPQSVRVATTELFVRSYIAISLVVPLQHICSAFLDIPKVTPPTKLQAFVNYKLDCRIHECNPVQFRFVRLIGQH